MYHHEHLDKAAGVCANCSSLRKLLYIIHLPRYGTTDLVMAVRSVRLPLLHIRQYLSNDTQHARRP